MSSSYLNACLGPHVSAAVLKTLGAAMAAKVEQLREGGQRRLAWEFEEGLDQLRRCVRQLDPASDLGKPEVPIGGQGSSLERPHGGGTGLTTGVAASKLGLTERGVIYHLKVSGRLRGVLVGGRWVVDPESVAEELERRSKR